MTPQNCDELDAVNRIILDATLWLQQAIASTSAANVVTNDCASYYQMRAEAWLCLSELDNALIDVHGAIF